ncbi:cytochrome C biogenesis [Abeliophyllum distichum]|uniref:Cytochrome C biogenesis n=1 Tax=Abeliophyllum distichum TaxID=126358 RepID=A0ABD1QW05_9LAMI
MRCPERRVEAFRPVAFPVPPSSGGACVGDAPPEIGLEALTLPTSRQLMAVGHDYFQKAPMKMNISHGGVCIFMLGVLLSCDPAAYVRSVARIRASIGGDSRVKDKKQNAPSPTALSSAGDFHEMKTGGIVVCSTFVALVYIPEYSYGRSVTQPT